MEQLYAHARQIIKETLFRLYQIMAEPTLLSGCENSTVREKNMKEMRQQIQIFEG